MQNYIVHDGGGGNDLKWHKYIFPIFSIEIYTVL